MLEYRLFSYLWCIIYRSFVTSWRGKQELWEANEVDKVQEIQKTQQFQKLQDSGSPSIILYRQ